MIQWVGRRRRTAPRGRRQMLVGRTLVWLVLALAAASCLEPEPECEDPEASCLLVSQCGQGQGHLSPGQCAGPAGTVCCVPESACPSEDVECCWGSWTSRPECRNGALVCPLGSTPAPGGTCLLASSCEQSGGTVAAAACCISSDDFPNTCLIGACGCSPSNSHEVSVCRCPAGQCFDGARCVQGG